MIKSKMNIVGQILKPHGIKSEVKVKASTSYPLERFKIGATLYYLEKDNYIPLKVKSYRPINSYELLSFENFDTVESLYPLLNKKIYAPMDKSLLEENKHFYQEYLGMKVFQNGLEKGIVKDIISLPQGDYLSILCGKKEKLVPLLDEFIVSFDEDLNILTIIDMEGLL